MPSVHKAHLAGTQHGTSSDGSSATSVCLRPKHCRSRNWIRSSRFPRESTSITMQGCCRGMQGNISCVEMCRLKRSCMIMSRWESSEGPNGRTNPFRGYLCQGRLTVNQGHEPCRLYPLVSCTRHSALISMLDILSQSLCRQNFTLVLSSSIITPDIQSSFLS